MLGYVCLRWPSPRGFPGRWGSLQQRQLEEIPSPSRWRLLSASLGEAWFEELGSAPFPWKTLPAEAAALAQGPETLAGWKSSQLGHGTESLRAGDRTCPLSLLAAQQSSCGSWACPSPQGPAHQPSSAMGTADAKLPRMISRGTKPPGQPCSGSSSLSPAPSLHRALL